MLRAIILIGIGGGIGSILRYLTNVLVARFFHSGFPFATLLVNSIGCLLIGIIFGLLNRHQIAQTDLRNLLIVGFCGGYTTFSAFALENYNLFTSGNSWIAFIYIASSVILSLFFVWLGVSLIK